MKERNYTDLLAETHSEILDAISQVSKLGLLSTAQIIALLKAGELITAKFLILDHHARKASQS